MPLKFVQQSLQYESDRDQGLVSMRDKYAEYLPLEALDAAADNDAKDASVTNTSEGSA